MLSYRHAFHAGNHGDVLKHAVLARILAYLTTKNSPLLYLDTHAGAGSYDLQQAMPRKTGEAAKGVGLIWAAREQAPALLLPYLQVLKAYNPDDSLHLYPGSPLLAQQILRPIDRAVYYELHSTDGPVLANTLKSYSRISIMPTDGLGGLKAHLPPKERRGLILIDPDYEQDTDYRTVPAALKEALQRFPTGVYILWYPLLQRLPMTRLIRAVTSLRVANVLHIELTVAPTGINLGMTGSGLWVINPPWVLATELRHALPWLAQHLGGADATWRLDKTPHQLPPSL